jgi:signal transduction histidine kinase
MAWIQRLPRRDLSSLLCACREEVLDHWRQRVAVEVEAAAALDSPILIDTLPILYDNIAEALGAQGGRAIATSGTNLANVHGRERASMTAYGPQDLIHELQIFREVLFLVAKKRGVRLGKNDADIIGHSIEEATRESIAGFSAANKELSEAFITSLSHDLRNPLHVVNASAQLIQMSSSDPHAAELARRIVEKIREADGMIETVLPDLRKASRCCAKLPCRWIPASPGPVSPCVRTQGQRRPLHKPSRWNSPPCFSN